MATKEEQKLFEKISELEMKLYYVSIQGNSDIKSLHTAAKEILIEYARQTGCHN